MHELSLTTWFIHLSSLFEWILAIIVIAIYSKQIGSKALLLLSLAMLPNLGSAMAAITWHIFDNSEELKFLVLIQATLTMIGNSFLAISAWNLYKVQESRT